MPENANGWEAMLNYIASPMTPRLHFATPDVSSDSEKNSYDKNLSDVCGELMRTGFGVLRLVAAQFDPSVLARNGPKRCGGGRRQFMA